MAKKSLTIGMPVDLSTLPPICEHCVTAKQTKMLVPKTRRGRCACRRLKIVHLDITGPEDVGTPHGEKYMLNFIDDHSGMAWIYLLKRKSDAYAIFQEWKALVEMRLENVSCSSALTMVESTHLMHSLNTCAMKASITR